LYLETVRRTKQIARQIVEALAITGPFNIQFIAKDNAIKVIECNVRASRSFPFVSKVTNYNFIRIATETLLGKHQPTFYQTLELDNVGVKSPQFSYNRLRGVDPISGVEMASTGEVACLGSDLDSAFYLSWLATDKQIKGKTILISVADEHKDKITEGARRLHAAGWKIVCTSGTHNYLKSLGIPSRKLFKISEKQEPSVVSALQEHKVSLMINIPTRIKKNYDALSIRRLGIDTNIPVVTNPEIAKILLRCLANSSLDALEPISWQEFVSNKSS
jgi:carbamoyl-phosphate synthase large subunit